MHFSGFDDENQGKLTIFGGYEQNFVKMQDETVSAWAKSPNGENEKQKERKEEKL